MNYLSHLIRSWKWSFILLTNGIFPNIWKKKVSDEICNNRDKKSRAHLLKQMYGIEENG